MVPTCHLFGAAKDSCGLRAIGTQHTNRSVRHCRGHFHQLPPYSSSVGVSTRTGVGWQKSHRRRCWPQVGAKPPSDSDLLRIAFDHKKNTAHYYLNDKEIHTEPWQPPDGTKFYAHVALQPPAQPIPCCPSLFALSLSPPLLLSVADATATAAAATPSVQHHVHRLSRLDLPPPQGQLQHGRVNPSTHCRQGDRAADHWRGQRAEQREGRDMLAARG